MEKISNNEDAVQIWQVDGIGDVLLVRPAVSSSDAQIRRAINIARRYNEAHRLQELYEEDELGVDDD